LSAPILSPKNASCSVRLILLEFVIWHQNKSHFTCSHYMSILSARKWLARICVGNFRR
jgi:hypothetical protein